MNTGWRHRFDAGALLRPLGIAAVLLATMGSVFAADGVGVLTRHFQVIENLENQVEQSLSKRDREALQSLLSPVFVQQQLGRPLLSRDGFMSSDSSLGRVELVHLHEAGGVLVAVLTSETYRGGLVTDVWQATDGTHWQLRLRILPVAKR